MSATTRPLITQYVNPIWEAALMYLQHNTFMPSLVQTFTANGWQERLVTEYAENGIQSNLGELQDLTPTLLQRNMIASLKPSEHGVQYIITDQRLEADTEDVMADAVQKIGYETSKFIDRTLMGHFSQFTGGDLGSAGGALTWEMIYRARAELAGKNIPGPYSLVLHEYQWFDLATAVNIVGTSLPAPLQIRDDIQSRYYVGTIAPDINIYVTGNLPVDSNDDAYAGLFNRQALAFDLRRALRIEPERDASLRSTELNATTVFASGIWRPRFGIRILADAASLVTAVTTNSDIAIFGSVDDSSLTNGTQAGVFDYIIVNNGTTIASNIVVTLTVPAGATFVNAEATQGQYTSASRIWQAGSLAPGGSARLRVRYTATQAGNFVGTITSVVPSDNVSGNNTATIAVTVV